MRVALICLNQIKFNFKRLCEKQEPFCEKREHKYTVDILRTYFIG